MKHTNLISEKKRSQELGSCWSFNQLSVSMFRV